MPTTKTTIHRTLLDNDVVANPKKATEDLYRITIQGVNYNILSPATSTAYGTIKIGYTLSGKNYPVALDSNGKAYVNVPWTDTKYTLPTATNTILGGVKPVAKTTAMTQSVGVDGNGALWTAPGSATPSYWEWDSSTQELLFGGNALNSPNTFGIIVTDDTIDATLTEAKRTELENNYLNTYNLILLQGIDGTILITHQDPTSLHLCGFISRQGEINPVEINKTTGEIIIDSNVKVVEITGLPDGATSGTLTTTQLAVLEESELNYIMYNHERYVLMDKGHTTDYLTYTHVGYENNKQWVRSLTITVSTRAWVINSQSVPVITTTENTDGTIDVTIE